MSRVLAFPTITRAEATPDGINIMVMNNDGIWQHSRVLGYSAAIRQLDDGGYDRDLATGMRIIAEIWEAEEKGYFATSNKQSAIVWRWLVACLFIVEQQERNGTVDIPNEDGGTDRAVKYVGKHGGISIYPATERFSLASHVEALAIERYGAEMGLSMAVQMYQSMTETVPGKGLRLSQFGREGLAMLHDDFIEMLNTEGIPAAPVAH